jgi:hypothetical protein
VSLRTVITAPIQRPKAMFYFYSPLQTVFSSPTVSDTTAVSTSSTTRTTAKTYTLTIPSPGNRIRVIVYGRVTLAPNTMTVYLNIDGVDVASASTDSVVETIVLDYNGSITPGAHTIRIDFLTGVGRDVYITRVYIATGIGLTSTTLTDLITFSVTYQLLRSGDIRYSPGVRLFIYGNRRTTSTARFEVGSGSVTGRNQLGAGNDNATAEAFLAILTGSVTLQEGGEFTVSATLRGNIGASGDIVIITRILARAQLRIQGGGFGEVRVYERGVVEYFARALLVSVPGGGAGVQHWFSRRDLQDRFLSWHQISGSGADVVLYNFRIAVVAPVHFTSSFNEDYVGEGFLEWVQLVVWG